MINHFLDYEFIYIFLLSSILFLLISIFIKQKIIRKLSILLFSIFIIFSLFEIAISMSYHKSKIEYNHKYLRKIRSDNIREYREIEFFDKKNRKCKFKNNKDILNINNYDYCNTIYDVIYSVYNNGFRQTKGDKNSKEAYIFLGCSFTFGDGLNDDETLPYYFSKLFDFKKNVINCGISSTSTNTALNILNNKLILQLINVEDYQIKRFIFSLIEEHIYRNFRYEGNCLDGLMYKNKKWYIPTTIGKIKYIFARSYMFRKIFVPIIDEKFKQYYENYIVESLKKMNEIVKMKYNSKLTIIVWPEFDKDFINKLKETNLDLIFLPKYFGLENDYKIKYDRHPSAKANEEIAQILYEHILE